MSEPSAAPPSLTDRLQDVTEALAAATRPAGIFGIVLQPALAALDAAAGAVLLISTAGDRLEIAATHAREDGTPTIWQNSPLDATLPTGDALIQHMPQFFEHQEALTTAYPALVERAGASVPIANAVLPMFLDGEPLGTIVLDFTEPHPFMPEERRFLRILAAQCAIAIGRARLSADLQRQVEARTRELQEAGVRAEVLATLGDALQRADSPEDVATLALEPLGHALGASSAMVVRLEHGFLNVPTIWGQVLPAMAALQTRDVPLQEATLLAECVRTDRAGYYADYNAARGGLSGLPTVAFAVEPIHGPGGGVAGFLCVWRPPRAQPWPEGDQDLLRRAAGTLGLALKRAENAAQLGAHTRQLDEERAALDAFVAYKTAVGSESDVLALARQAVRVVRANLVHVSVAYYELEDSLWKARVWSEDIPAHIVTQIRQGVPQDAPNYAQAARTGEAVFADGWSPAANAVEQAEAYGAAAFLPLGRHGQVQSLFSVGTRDARAWTEREKAMVQAVVSGLNLTLERTDITRRLQEQNAELDARTRALDAFAELWRDFTLQSDPYALIRRAQEVMLSLLPDGFALYYEIEDGRWRVRAQVGDLRNPELQAAVDAGLQLDTAPNLLTPWTTRKPSYQEQYPPNLDHLGDKASGVGATVTLPVMVEGEPCGVIAVVLFGARGWSAVDRVVLESTVRSLGLAIEGARGAAELRRASRFNELVLNSIGEGLTTTDVQGRSTLANPAALTMLGYAAEDFLDLPQHALIHHSYPDGSPFPREACAVYAASRDGQVHRRKDEVFWRKDGSSFPVEYTSTPILNEGGEIEGSVLVFRDVTERQRAEVTLREANEELRRSNQELEQFAYVASHDLQEPLRTVASFSQLLAHRYAGQFDERGQMYVRLMSEGTERMARLLQDLLAFSRVAHGNAALEPVNTGGILVQVRQDLDAQLGRTGAQLELGELPDVRGDASQLRQLFQNLIGNALKFSHPERPPVVRVQAQRDGALVRFSVQDNGVGIAPEYFERIFTIFQRLHTREQYEGSGIGLSIVRKIVERHGGRIWLESTPAMGTTFVFTLPAAEAGA
ncbi:GAF domain-containing protein [Deinococcus sp. QL22]|uniref:GAF domain-containing protein n=1 Tax=Deinococcus sp. QL22 TaxID=2939437 RepID=UPI00273A666B|nr:GAF domain-containing protein [Deinococcus sp. QL22]